MLFHITQAHSPEQCPKGAAGPTRCSTPTPTGVTLVGRYGANAQHTMFYVVEADDVDALQKFLWPGFTVHEHDHPVSESPVPLD